jgi:hypothetical protein
MSQVHKSTEPRSALSTYQQEVLLLYLEHLYDHSSSNMKGRRFIFPSHLISIHQSFIQWPEGPLFFHEHLYDHSSSSMNGWRFIFQSHPISIHQWFIQWRRFRFHSMDTCMITQVLLWMVEGSLFHPILYPSIHHSYNGRDSAFIPWILVWSFKFY